MKPPPDARWLVESLASGRSLAHAAGIPDATLDAIGALAAWAEGLGELGLARALWQGLAALEERRTDASLAVARVALAQGDTHGAWEAASVVARHSARPDERRAAIVVGARVALAHERPDEALRLLDGLSADGLAHDDPLVAALRAQVERAARQSRFGSS